MRVSTMFLLAGASALLAGCGGSTEPDSKTDAAALPADVTAFVTRAGACLSWSDEARHSGPNAAATPDQVMAAWTENRCESLADDASALRAANPGDAAVTAALDGAMNPPETAGAPASASAPASATPATGEAGLAVFLEKAETCSHVAGEMGDDAEQNAQLNRTWEQTGCEFLEAETAATRQAYAGNDAVLTRVGAAVEPLGY